MLSFSLTYNLAKVLHRKKLEDVVSDEDAVEIKNMKNLSMIDFEAKLWAKYGRTYCEPCDRAMVCKTFHDFPLQLLLVINLGIKKGHFIKKKKG